MVGRFPGPCRPCWRGPAVAALVAVIGSGLDAASALLLASLLGVAFSVLARLGGAASSSAWAFRFRSFQRCAVFAGLGLAAAARTACLDLPDQRLA